MIAMHLIEVKLDRDILISQVCISLEGSGVNSRDAVKITPLQSHTYYSKHYKKVDP